MCENSSLLALGALWTWGRYLEHVLIKGDRLTAEVAAIVISRETTVVVRLADGSERRIVVVGVIPLHLSDLATTSYAGGKSWPVLIENVFRAA